jgi:hypothetical protein
MILVRLPKATEPPTESNQSIQTLSFYGTSFTCGRKKKIERKQMNRTNLANHNWKIRKLSLVAPNFQDVPNSGNGGACFASPSHSSSIIAINTIRQIWRKSK